MKIKAVALKAIMYSITLTLLAGMPLLSNLLPDTINYTQTNQTVLLPPGSNRIDNVVITLDKAGKVLQAQKIHRQITQMTFGFRNLRIFLIGGAPFLSLLAFCLFFFWYDRQPKTRYALILKRCVWSVFFFVSIWFTCWVFIIQCDAIPKVFRYTGIYIAAIGSFTAAYYLYRYYSSHKYSKIALRLRRIFALWEAHYPHGAYENSYKVDWRAEACQRLEDREAGVLKTLDRFYDTEEKPPRDVDIAINPRLVKFFFIGLFLAALALIPLTYQFASRQVSYIETAQTIPLHPGLNILDNLALSLSPAAKLLHAEKTERQIYHKVFGFRNSRVFLLNAAPFFSLLSFCLFFFWYERQQKNRHVRILKNYTLGVFFLVSLWFTGWTFIPEMDPIPPGFYQMGGHLALGLLIGGLIYLYDFYGHRLPEGYDKFIHFITHIFEFRKGSRQPIPVQAPEEGVIENTHRQTESKPAEEALEEPEEGFPKKFRRLREERAKQARVLLMKRYWAYQDRKEAHYKELLEQIRILKEGIKENRYTEEEVKCLMEMLSDWTPDSFKGF